LELVDGSCVIGRLGATADAVTDLVIRASGDWTVRRIPLAEIRNAVVQVEFSPPNAKELELVGVTGTEAEA
jgi:ribosome maturation factor RimP